MAAFARRVTKENLVYYTAPLLEETGVARHAFSTRLGGTADELNLGAHTDISRERLEDNYARFCGAAGIDPRRLVLAEQTHSDHIAVVDKSYCGSGLYVPSLLSETDALVTDRPGVALATFYADCTPILLLDPVRRVAASVHSGWRGTLARIGRKAVQLMRERFGCDPADIRAAIGPSIMQCHFEVGPEVAAQFAGTFGADAAPHMLQRGEKFYIDTQSINVGQLCAEGIRRGHIALSGLCTVCRRDEFFSHRGDGAGTGRLCAVIELT